MTFLDRYIGRFVLLIFALLFLAFFMSSAAQAQTSQPWDTNIVSFIAPTTCTSGQPIANCPVTGYRIERSAAATGTFAAVGTSTTTTFTHTGAVAGLNCYRAIAMSPKGDSVPSNVACKTNVAPSGPPNPPTNLTVVDPLAYDVRPNESTFAFDRGRAVGTAKLGAACDEARTTGQDYYAIERPSRVKLTRAPRSTALVARCGASS
jgi:hypothetical protein